MSYILLATKAFIKITLFTNLGLCLLAWSTPQPSADVQIFQHPSSRINSLVLKLLVAQSLGDTHLETNEFCESDSLDCTTLYQELPVQIL